MQRICFTLQVRRDRIAEYKAAHANVWPEMREALSRRGWHNYCLFLRDDGLLIGYVETADFGKAVADMQQEPVNALWQSQMKDLFEPLAAGTADKAMTPLDQVFYLP